MPNDSNSMYHISVTFSTHQDVIPQNTTYECYADSPSDIKKQLAVCADEYELLVDKARLLLERKNAERRKKNGQQ